MAGPIVLDQVKRQVLDQGHFSFSFSGFRQFGVQKLVLCVLVFADCYQPALYKWHLNLVFQINLFLEAKSNMCSLKTRKLYKKGC